MITYLTKFAAMNAAESDLGSDALPGRDYSLFAQVLPNGREVWTWTAGGIVEVGFDGLGVRGTTLTEADESPSTAELEAHRDSELGEDTDDQTERAAFNNLVYRQKVRQARREAFGEAEEKFAIEETSSLIMSRGFSIRYVAVASLEDAQARIARTRQITRQLTRLFSGARIIVVDPYQWEAINRGDWDCYQYNPDQHALKLTEDDPI